MSTSKPKFDPSKPFSAAKPKFDPSKPFEQAMDEGPSALESSLRGGIQGVSRGLSDEILANNVLAQENLKKPITEMEYDDFGRPITQKFAGPGQEGYEVRQQVLEDERMRNDAAKKANPLAYGASEVVGGLSGPASIGGIAADVGSAAFGQSTSQNPMEIAQETAKGALLGGAIGGVGKYAIEPLVKSGVQKSDVVRKYLSDKLAKKAEEKAVESLNPTLSQIERLETGKNINNVGRDILDSKVLGKGIIPASPVGIYKNLESTSDEVGQKVGAILNTADKDWEKKAGANAPGYFDSAEVGIDIISELQKRYKDSPLYRGLGVINQDLEQFASKPNRSFAELNKFKADLGHKIKTWGVENTAEKGLYEDYYSLLNKKIEDGIEAVGGEETKGAFKEAKSLYGNLETGEKMAKKASLRERKNNDIGLTSYGAMGAGAVVGGVPGAIAAATLRELTRSRGNPALAKSFDYVSKYLQSNPDFAAKFGAVLDNAAKRGPAALSAAHTALLNNDQDYSDVVNSGN